jgi:hypothetical protein
MLIHVFGRSRCSQCNLSEGDHISITFGFRAGLTWRWMTLASLNLRYLMEGIIQPIDVGDGEASLWLNRCLCVRSSEEPVRDRG